MSFLSNSETGSLINRHVSLYKNQPSVVLTRHLENRFSQDLRLVDIDLPVALAIFLFGNSSFTHTRN